MARLLMRQRDLPSQQLSTTHLSVAVPWAAFGDRLLLLRDLQSPPPGHLHEGITGPRASGLGRPDRVPACTKCARKQQVTFAKYTRL